MNKAIGAANAACAGLCAFVFGACLVSGAHVAALVLLAVLTGANLWAWATC